MQRQHPRREEVLDGNGCVEFDSDRGAERDMKVVSPMNRRRDAVFDRYLGVIVGPHLIAGLSELRPKAGIIVLEWLVRELSLLDRGSRCESVQMGDLDNPGIHQNVRR